MVVADDRIAAIEARLANLERDAAVDKAMDATMERRLASIEDTQKWIFRVIIGAVLAAGMAYALQGGFVQ